MKSVDLESTVVAGLIGATVLTLITMILNANAPTTSNPYGTLPVGFVVGAGVQVGVRMFGVS